MLETGCGTETRPRQREGKPWCRVVKVWCYMYRIHVEEENKKTWKASPTWSLANYLYETLAFSSPNDNFYDSHHKGWARPVSVTKNPSQGEGLSWNGWIVVVSRYCEKSGIILRALSEEACQFLVLQSLKPHTIMRHLRWVVCCQLN